MRGLTIVSQARPSRFTCEGLACETKLTTYPSAKHYLQRNKLLRSPLLKQQAVQGRSSQEPWVWLQHANRPSPTHIFIPYTANPRYAPASEANWSKLRLPVSSVIAVPVKFFLVFALDQPYPFIILRLVESQHD